MNRFFYSTLLYLATPLVMLRMFLRGRKAPAYRQRWRERFGFFPALPQDKPVIWVHSVSVGETIASAPLVTELLERYPRHRILITTMTPTGSDRVKALYNHLIGDRIEHVYCPYDLPDAQMRFFNRVRPELALMIDTELWPNTIAACHKRNIPVVIVNARLSERSARGYARLKGLVSTMLKQTTMVACQNKDDGERFIQLGLPEQQLDITGSVKFDLSVSPELKEAGKQLKERWSAELGYTPLVITAASTHEGEDQPILDAFNQLQANHKNLLLILVPRHPERFDPVFELAVNNQCHVVRRSEQQPLSPSTQVLLGDTMGEMMTFFAASDIAFVGGSLIERGGHNMLEPAVLGLPVLSGPHVFNFQDISDSLVKAGGMQLVDSAEQLADSIDRLMTDKQHYQTMSDSAAEFVASNRGALQRTLTLIGQQLPAMK
ncbi:3-deoxy-D-manno-octulosonic acid transferase [Endozoicomonas montiporae]|uniref:3-deoxy-D-manno-octulosonic acid transferase n=2 Tax=Endozoicomonas montiporae TaxID=1027273 RepID=A0A081N458_9GAMM|nr:lipid IV(A) 3-deoxy-D-manno-octulosonic acid transferase [Endozoicomonas montiporae]AMO57935.1 3-deoxy-D-manno-octulosonic-acid transferase [Endozoicomonas montiporae CL-33]KEQ13231.1 3-deoxy-D-manno-octulosonic acid transferase [Endozoicomonas montiporae]